MDNPEVQLVVGFSFILGMAIGFFIAAGLSVWFLQLT